MSMKRGAEDKQNLPYASGCGPYRGENGLLGGLLEQWASGLVGSARKP